ncbi:hypothetical protein [Pantoea latae]|nr:hypothetical protein [Pantoea latae]
MPEILLPASTTARQRRQKIAMPHSPHSESGEADEPLNIDYRRRDFAIHALFHSLFHIPERKDDMTTASDLAQQAIDTINALKTLAENGASVPDDIQAQLDSYAVQVKDLEARLETQQDVSEVYRNEILSNSEFLGFAVEIINKIQALLDSGVINTMPVEEQRQLQETLMYITERQKNDDDYRKAGDPKPRSFEEYRNPV